MRLVQVKLNNNTEVFVNPSAILYMETSKDGCNIFLTNEEVLTSKDPLFVIQSRFDCATN